MSSLFLFFNNSDDDDDDANDADESNGDVLGQRWTTCALFNREQLGTVL